jgi:hypothetical protein
LPPLSLANLIERQCAAGFVRRVALVVHSYYAPGSLASIKKNASAHVAIAGDR